MKNSGGSLAFNGQDNADKPGKALKQYDYNQSRLSPKTTGTRTNLRGNIGGDKSCAAPDQASNDRGPVVGTVKPMNWKGPKVADRHVDSNFVGKRGPTRGNQECK
jgi:hypothetical protein